MAVELVSEAISQQHAKCVKGGEESRPFLLAIGRDGRGASPTGMLEQQTKANKWEAFRVAF